MGRRWSSFFLRTLLLLAGGSGACLQAAETMPPNPALRTLAFDCGRTQVVVVLLTNHATVYLPRRGATLTYAGQDNDGTERYTDAHSALSLNADTAELTMGGRRLPRCRANATRSFWAPAVLRGSELHAGSDDLPWTLDFIRHDEQRSIRFAPGDGTPTRWFRESMTDATDAQGLRQVRVSDGTDTLVLLLEPASCALRTPALVLPYRISLRINSELRTGCAGPPP